MFLLTMLWTRVTDLDDANKARDRDLAVYFLEIEHRMTVLETKQK